MSKTLPMAMVRHAECQALRSLKPMAAKVWIAIRYGRRDTEPFSVGCRDFTDWDIGKTAAATAIKELVEAGLLRVLHQTGFGRRGDVTEYEFVHTRASEQSAIADRSSQKSPHRRTGQVKTVRESGQHPRKQSAYADTPSSSLLPTSVRNVGSKEQAEVPRPVSEPPPELGVVRTGPDDTAVQSRQAIERAAEAIGLPKNQRGNRGRAFMDKAGSFGHAKFLALKFQRGDFSVDQLRRQLANPPPSMDQQQPALPYEPFMVAV